VGRKKKCSVSFFRTLKVEKGIGVIGEEGGLHDLGEIAGKGKGGGNFNWTWDSRGTKKERKIHFLSVVGEKNERRALF